MMRNNAHKIFFLTVVLILQNQSLEIIIAALFPKRCNECNLEIFRTKIIRNQSLKISGMLRFLHYLELSVIASGEILILPKSLFSQ